MSMNILLVNRALPVHVAGGLERHVEDLALGLADAGLRPHLLTAPLPAAERQRLGRGGGGAPRPPPAAPAGGHRPSPPPPRPPPPLRPDPRPGIRARLLESAAGRTAADP